MFLNRVSDRPWEVQALTRVSFWGGVSSLDEYHMNSIQNSALISMLNPAHLKELIASTLDSEEANLIAFSADAEQAHKATGYRLPGLVFPYLDPLIGGSYTRKSSSKWMKDFGRLKPDWEQVDEATKREWRDRYNGNLPKYLSPPKSGSRPYFCPLLNWGKYLKSAKQMIAITEGEKKAAALCAAGIPTIGLSGVTAWVDRSPRSSKVTKLHTGSEWDVDPEIIEGETVIDKSRILPELLDVEWAYRKVAIVFDSDITSKPQVKAALVKLADTLRRKLGAQPFPVVLPNELDGAKNGVDDFIYRHGIDAFYELMTVYERLQETDGQILKLTKPKKEGGEMLLETHPISNRLIPRQSFYWTKYEPSNNLKAIAATSVLKESVKYRRNTGWYVWSSKIWKLTDKAEVESLIFDFCLKQGWIENTDSTIGYITRHLKARVAEKADQAIAWNDRAYRVYENGTYDFSRKVFMQGVFDRRHLQTIKLSYNYTPYTETERRQLNDSAFGHFLKEATGDDKRVMRLIRAIFRWVLTPKPVGESFPLENIFDFFGSRGTGKGTLLDALRYVAGEENCGAFDQQSISTAEGRAELLDKLVAIDSDAQGHWSQPGLLNKLCSNEPVSVRRLFEDAGSVRLGVVLVRAYNTFQSVGAGAEGLDRRQVVISFNHPPKTKDLDLKHKIKGEAGLIAAWALAMKEAEMRECIQSAGSIGSVGEAMLDRALANDSVLYWLSETKIDGTNGVAIAAAELYREYADWVKNEGISALKSQNFFNKLKSWARFGVEFGRTSQSKIYKIPKFRSLLDAGLLPLDTKNLDFFAKNAGCAGSSAGSSAGLNPYTVTGVPGMPGLEEKVSQPEKNKNSPQKNLDSPEKTPQPGTPHTQQGSNPALDPALNPTPGTQPGTQINLDVPITDKRFAIGSLIKIPTGEQGLICCVATSGEVAIALKKGISSWYSIESCVAISAVTRRTVIELLKSGIERTIKQLYAAYPDEIVQVMPLLDRSLAYQVRHTFS